MRLHCTSYHTASTQYIIILCQPSPGGYLLDTTSSLLSLRSWKNVGPNFGAKERKRDVVRCKCQSGTPPQQRRTSAGSLLHQNTLSLLDGSAPVQYTVLVQDPPSKARPREVRCPNARAGRVAKFLFVFSDTFLTRLLRGPLHPLTSWLDPVLARRRPTV